MPALPASVVRGVLLTGFYFAGAVIAVLYLRTPADVTLFWPAAGIAYATTLHFGLRYALAAALGQLLLHLWVVPVPLKFLPFSVASNALAAAIASAYVRRRRRVLEFRMRDGLLLLRGGFLLAAISAAIGVAGMLAAGMLDRPAWAPALLQWALGDLLGVTAVAPTLLFLLNRHRRNARHPWRAEGSLRERLVWSVLMLVCLLGALAVAGEGTLYPLALASLPLALMLWCASRFPPLFTATATTVVTVYFALALGLGLGSFERPRTPLDGALLMGALTVYSVIPMLLIAAFQERSNAMADLHIRATRDPLTGLLNRDAFRHEAAERLATEACPLTLLYTDLDHFKLVNDSGTHLAGDEMIRVVAARVREVFEPDALVGRTGGDEFAILAPLDENAATTRARRLLEAIEGARVAWQGQNLAASASIGLSSSTPPHAGFDELLAQADIACFEAKELGGNRIVGSAAHAGEREARTRQMHHARAAREALDARRFELWCQPIVNLRQAEADTRHFEVLLRWRDPRGRLHPPAELVAAAERYRLGPRLDRYVLDATLGWLSEHPDAARRITQCNLNIGAATLVDDEFGDYFATRLRRSLLRPEQVCLEITETSVARDMTRARRFIERMRDLGCRFALDDFGTGFCSFSYLRDLDVDYIKIDGSFVRDLDRSRLSEAVVQSITDIAHVLGKRAVGEQAESERQLEQLRRIGVDYAQGHVFRRPQAIGDFFAREAA